MGWYVTADHAERNEFTEKLLPVTEYAGRAVPLPKTKVTRVLSSIVSERNSVARFTHVESCDSEAGKDAVEEFWQCAVESRSEGLMVKVGVLAHA